MKKKFFSMWKSVYSEKKNVGYKIIEIKLFIFNIMFKNDFHQVETDSLNKQEFYFNISMKTMWVYFTLYQWSNIHRNFFLLFFNFQCIHEYTLEFYDFHLWSMKKEHLQYIHSLRAENLNVELSEVWIPKILQNFCDDCRDFFNQKLILSNKKHIKSK